MHATGIIYCVARMNLPILSPLFSAPVSFYKILKVGEPGFLDVGAIEPDFMAGSTWTIFWTHGYTSGSSVILVFLQDQQGIKLHHSIPDQLDPIQQLEWQREGEGNHHCRRIDAWAWVCELVWQPTVIINIVLEKWIWKSHLKILHLDRTRFHSRSPWSETGQRSNAVDLRAVTQGLRFLSMWGAARRWACRCLKLKLKLGTVETQRN